MQQLISKRTIIAMAGVFVVAGFGLAAVALGVLPRGVLGFADPASLLTQEEPLSPEEIRELVAWTTTAGPNERVTAFARLNREPSESARPALAELWEHGSPAEREIASTIFVSRWPSEALPHLERQLRSPESDLTARLASLSAAAQIGGPRAAEMLREGLLSTEPDVRNLACEVLRTYDFDPKTRAVQGRFRPYASRFTDILQEIRTSDASDGVLRTHANCAMQVLTADRLPNCFHNDQPDLDVDWFFGTNLPGEKPSEKPSTEKPSTEKPSTEKARSPLPKPISAVDPANAAN